LSERDGHVSTLPSDQDEHVMRADVVRRQAHDLYGFDFPERRDDVRGQALRLERETDFVFQIVILEAPDES